MRTAAARAQPEDFSRTWEVDVQAGFHWIGASLRQPLPPGSRVLIGSSGAAVNGSPLSGSYAGGKRMLWLMAHCASGVSGKRELGIHYQAIVPQRIIGETALGRPRPKLCRAAGRQRRGLSRGLRRTDAAAAGGRACRQHLTDPQHENGVAFGLKGDCGIVPLDA